MREKRRRSVAAAKARRLLFSPISKVFIAILAAAVFSVASSCNAQKPSTLVVTSYETNLHGGPGRNQLDVKLFRGAACRLIESTRFWHKVRLRNGVTGWLPVWETTAIDSETPLPELPAPSSLKASPQSPVAAVVYSDFAVLRSQPTNTLPATSDHTRIAIAEKGAPLFVIGSKGHWLKVRTGQMEKAWIYDESLAFAPYVSAHWPARIDKLIFNEDATRYILGVRTSQRVPYLAKSNGPNVTVTFYGAEYAADAIEGETSAPPPGAVSVAKGYAATAVTFALPYSPQGFTAGYSGNILVLSIKKAKRSAPGSPYPLNGFTVAIDAGHGSTSNPPGLNLGASSRRYGIRENELNLIVARRLADLVLQAGGTPVLTRNSRTDETNSLSSRVEIAQAASADVFVSIHANSAHSGGANGFEAYWYDPQSAALARTITYAVLQSTSRAKGRTGYSSFGVIRQTDMPSVLLELGYLSNASDSAFFVQPGAIDKYATGILNGIVDFFDVD